METEKSASPRNNHKRWLIAGAALILLVVGAFFGYRHWRWSASHVSTDDAYVSADLTYVAPRVAGRVIQVAVAHNQLVQPGDLLVRIDPRDFEVRAQQAEEALKLARNELAQQRAGVAAAQAQVVLAQARARQAEEEARRRAELYRQQVVAREHYERYRRDAEVAQAELAAARQQLARAQVAEVGLEAQIRQREAALREAGLQLSYTTILAPVAGQVTRRTVEVGNQVDIGQPLMVLVPLHRLWVEANFKETELARVRPGQRAEVRIDTYRGHLFHGRVDSIMAGTGSALSLLPPENATGNWVKVVQRIPVRVVLDAREHPEEALRVGQSAEVTIDLTSSAEGRH